MSQRRGAGEGAIYYSSAHGRWEAALDKGRRPDGRRDRITLSGRTRAEVRAKLREAQRAVEAGLPTGQARMTADVCGRYMANLPAAVRSPNTVDGLRWAIDRHILPAIGSRRLRDLLPGEVEDMLRARSAAGVSGSSLRRIHGTLKRVLRYAERHGLASRNVAGLVDCPDGPAKVARSLTIEQASTLLAAARGDRLEALYVTALAVGLRPGEALGLPWSAVSLDLGRLTVGQSLKRHREGLVIGETKTPRSRRVLDLPPFVVEILRAHRSRQAAERLAVGAAWTDTGLVFTTSIGTPIDPSNLRRGLHRLTTLAGLGHWHPHALRHSAASILSAAGVPIEQISDVLGHEGPRTTAAVYRHLITPTVSAGSAPMQSLFGE